MAADFVVPPGPVTLTAKVYFRETVPVSAGSVTGTLTASAVDPAAHGRVTGKPLTAGVTDTAHVADRRTVTLSTACPPAAGRPSGEAVNVTACGASRTTTAAGLALVVPPGPLTLRLNEYPALAALVLACSFTVRLACPDEHDTVTGSPFTFGVAPNVQVLARLTFAVSLTLPPLAGREAGLAWNEVTDGAVVAEASAGAEVNPRIRLAASPEQARIRRHAPTSGATVQGSFSAKTAATHARNKPEIYTCRQPVLPAAAGQDSLSEPCPNRGRCSRSQTAAREPGTRRGR